MTPGHSFVGGEWVIYSQPSLAGLQSWRITRNPDGSIMRAERNEAPDAEPGIVLARTNPLKQIETSNCTVEQKEKMLAGIKNLEDSFSKSNDPLLST